MNKHELSQKLYAISMERPGGFTVDSKTLQPVTSGYAVAIEDTQNSFNYAGVMNVIEAVTSGLANAYGGWLDVESDLYYYDATIVVDDYETAYKLAVKNKQIAFFDLNRMEEIRIPQQKAMEF